MAPTNSCLKLFATSEFSQLWAPEELMGPFVFSTGFSIKAMNTDWLELRLMKHNHTTGGIRLLVQRREEINPDKWVSATLQQLND